VSGSAPRTPRTSESGPATPPAPASAPGRATPRTSESLPAVLAIDGGNSKTDVALVAADGSVLGRARGDGVPGMLAADRTLAALSAAVADAARAAGLADRRPVARQLAACIANADLPEEEERLSELLSAQGWAQSALVANDTFAVLRAGLDGAEPRYGIGVTCGAGINCVGVAPDGRTTRFLALGDISGDWGGGASLGVAAVWSAVRAEDGRGPPTALREAVAAQLGAATMRDVTIGLHTGVISYDALRRLVPAVFAVAGRGDAVARDIVRRQAEEICVMATTAIRRLGLADEAVTVVLGGGVLAARDPLLTCLITEFLALAAPRATPRVVDAPPVVGAALLGLDELGAAPGVLAGLRSAFRSTNSP
jgi:N-acetylglucosamine kinase-like BadF-type ATPase